MKHFILHILIIISFLMLGSLTGCSEIPQNTHESPTPASTHTPTLTCTLATSAPTPTCTVATPTPSASAEPTFGKDVKILFLHHSTGGCIWGGGVPAWFDTYNTVHSLNYQITEQAYPSDPYPWQNYPYDYWLLWVQHSGSNTYQSQSTLEMFTANYNVIIWKHCFPVSYINADTGSPDITSSQQTLENYKLQYNALKTKMLQFPETSFIVWTGAALVQSATSAEQAQRARQFFTWVKNEWDEPGDNIYVWDFFELETEGGNYLKDEYAASPGDSHPSSSFSSTVAPYFCQRIVDVIQGKGDTTSLTGKIKACKKRTH